MFGALIVMKSGAGASGWRHRREWSPAFCAGRACGTLRLCGAKRAFAGI